jgi:hypothetical protein
MFGLDGSYSMYVAFLRGYEVGSYEPGSSAERWLGGFNEWLVGKLGTGRNLGWDSLILRVAFPDRPDQWKLFVQRDMELDRMVSETLFSQLREFLSHA